MSAVLEVHKVGKVYHAYRRERHRLMSWFGLPVKPSAQTWVLQDISFEVGPGEAVGIIGQNGAGKSTLLKIITGTLAPSTGEVRACGKVAAILELGMGFHPELTGRQNAYHAASLMGYSHQQIEDVIDKIHQFSEVGEYFDQPVRTYSSGMQMRVAFAVATAHRPDILIVDEALSVGDAYFQHKCFNLIRAFQAQGTSLLFVSHDSASIQSLCNRAILLHKGKLLKIGTPQAIIDLYNASLADPELNTARQSDQPGEDSEWSRSGTGEALLQRVQVQNTEGLRLATCQTGQPVVLNIIFQVNAELDGLVCGFVIRDRTGNWVFGINSRDYGHQLDDLRPGDEVSIDFAFDLNLGEGSYSISVALTRSHRSHVEKNYDWVDLATVIKVVNSTKRHFAGLVWLDAQVEVAVAKAGAIHTNNESTP